MARPFLSHSHEENPVHLLWLLDLAMQIPVMGRIGRDEAGLEQQLAYQAHLENRLDHHLLEPVPAAVLGPNETGNLEKGLALKIVNTFLSTDFEGGRHANRVNKINC